MNPEVLATLDSEDIMIDIAGWAAGNYDPIVEKYAVNFEKIEEWIQKAKNSQYIFLIAKE